MNFINKNLRRTIIFIIMFFVAIAASLSYGGQAAYAVGQINFEVLQVGAVYYNDVNYISSGSFADLSSEEGLQNALYDSMIFKADGVEVNVNSSNITFVGISELIVPKTYNVNLNIMYGGTNYEKSIAIVIQKPKLYVGVKINGETLVTIDEGVSYTTEVTYSGFVGNDTIDVLEIPAIIYLEPKRPVSNYTIVASGAKSNLYEFVYVGAVINIISKPLTSIASSDKTSLIIGGEFSPYCELDYVNVGISPTSSIYVTIKQNLDRYYASSGIYNEYKETEAYSINLLIDGIKEENQAAEIKVKLAEKNKGKEKYLVTAFYNNGMHEVLTAREENGYLLFSAADLGNFVVFTPIEGMSTTVLIAICIGIVGGFILIIFLIAIFRRKY
ncbi:MAG: hypothetical protein EOM87_00095 [Clostridia bacterium]|nr:hypothetical protein [Clostridia bacterium]